jgi:hypothetical protein
MAKSRVYLKKTATGKLAEAILLDEVSDVHLMMWNDTWKPAMEKYCASNLFQDKPEDEHWNWRKKANGWRSMLGYHSFALVCEDELQGLMLASDFQSARLPVQFGKPMVFVEFLAAAPWNRIEFQNPRKYIGVGSVMILAAVELSAGLGYHGRIGLCSLPAAEAFYKTKCGMSELGKDAAHENLMYYEMTEQQAEAFRAKKP